MDHLRCSDCNRPMAIPSGMTDRQMQGVRRICPTCSKKLFDKIRKKTT